MHTETMKTSFAM